MDLRLLLPPVAGLVIGWLTNYVAIKMLFRPLVPVRIFGYNFQGLIPKRRKEISKSIAQAIEKELLSSDDIASTLGSIDWKEEVEKSVEEVVDHRFGKGRLSGVPVIGLVSENLKYHIKYIVTKEIVRQIDRKKGSIAARFKDNVDVKELLLMKIDNLDLARFEGLLTGFIAKELKHLEYLGGLIGFLIGLSQSALIYFTGSL
jgi:uncharacterized membrane protein YheB (UPF0754 family)